jgi:hypothetical protein
MSMADDMWALVPAVYRRRDADASGVLRALIEVLGEQAGFIRDDIARLYDNWFIETCDDWVVPYIGDLTRALSLAPVGEPPSPAEAGKLARVASQRLLAANAIRFRRRKGCFSIIVQIARDVARWPTQAVEFGTRLALNEDMRNPSRRGFTAAVRDPRPLALLGTPEDPLARSIDVREAASLRSPGCYSPANIGVFVFAPLIARIVKGDAFCVDEEGSTCFTFDALGQDTPLYHPALAGPDRLPGPITRGRLAVRRREAFAHAGWHVDPAYYGEKGCTRIWTQQRDGDEFKAVEDAEIMPADLASWRELPPPGFVAVDPERGRIAFPPHTAPRRVQVAYAYAMPAAIGGGDYPRPAMSEVFPPDAVYPVTALQEEGHNSLRSAVEQWHREGKQKALIEFRDSLTYNEDRLVIDLSGGGRQLVIRAAPHVRPVIRLSDYEAGAADAWRIRGDDTPAGAVVSLLLEGLAIAGRGIALSEYGGSLEIRHCTLFPGWLPPGERGRRHAEAPSLSFENCTGSLSVAASILGPIFVRTDEHVGDPLPVWLADSILDAGEGRDVFISSSAVPYLSLTICRCTVFGAAAVHAVPLAENSIFTDALAVARRGSGCVRFCALPMESRTPRRSGCVPRAGEDASLRPSFVSRKYGTVGYAVLAPSCPDPIARGADDRSEMGVFHDLFRPQRETNLRAALAEYLPAGASVGITYLT